MEEQFVHTHKLKISNPLKPYSAVTAIAGGIILIESIVRLLEVSTLLNPDTLERMMEVYDPGSWILLIVRGLFCVVGLIAGCVYALKGLKNLISFQVPADIPKEFARNANLANSLRNRRIYAYEGSEGLTLARALISENVIYLTRNVSEILRKNLSLTIRMLFVLGAIAAFFLAKSFIIVSMADDELVDILMNYPVPVSLIMLAVIGAGIRFGTSYLFIPSQLPDLQTIEKVQYIEGARDPAEILPLIEQHAYNIMRRVPFNNRVVKTDLTFEEEGVQDTGAFEAHITIENQPEPIEHQVNPAAHIYLVCGAILLLVGYSTLLFVEGNSLGLVNTIVFGLVSLAMGSGFLKSANALYNVFQFSSEVVYCDIRGSFGRTEVTAGRSMTDSIESKNILKRSDFTVKYYTAVVISEASPLNGLRDVVELKTSSKVEDLVNLFEVQVNTLTEKGARIQRVDLSDEGLSDVMNANIAISRVKDTQNEAALSLTGKSKLMLEDSSESDKTPSSTPQPGYKKCPYCAEEILIEAIKCRYCQSMLDDTSEEQTDNSEDESES